VNTWISEAHAAKIEVLPLAEAKARGAVAMFGEKYGDEVRVIDFPGVSMELCGGTHVNNTAEIGVFKVISEAGVSSGVRRIEAVSGASVLDYLNVRDQVTKDLCFRFKIKPEEIPDRITTLQTELLNSHKLIEALKAEIAIVKSDVVLEKSESASKSKMLVGHIEAIQKQLDDLKDQLTIQKSEGLLQSVETIGEHKIIVAQLEDVDAESLKAAAERLLQKISNGAVVLGSIPEEGKVSIVAAFSSEVNKKGIQAGKFVGAVAKICGGG
ncbi:MAG: DHHA1 domain-containing protein, partial [Sphaerospermopsis kisseleviana]